MRKRCENCIYVVEANQGAECPDCPYEDQSLTPEKQALMRAVEIYLKCDPGMACSDDCKLLRRHIGEWAICSHLREAGGMMLKREQGK